MLTSLADLLHKIIDKVPWFEEAERNAAHDVVSKHVGDSDLAPAPIEDVPATPAADAATDLANATEGTQPPENPATVEQPPAPKDEVAAEDAPASSAPLGSDPIEVNDAEGNLLGHVVNGEFVPLTAP